jgi:hypothetical protein
VLTEAEFGLFFEGANLEKRFIDSPIEIRRDNKKVFHQRGQLQSANL